MQPPAQWDNFPNEFLMGPLSSNQSFTHEECTRISEQYSSLENREGTVGERLIGTRLRQSDIQWNRLNHESQR
ncbi:MAG: hypothetical protein ACFCD0_26285, partial [Gemmataceae bacterium]